MKPELKFGRKVIAWEDYIDPVKGDYIKFQPDGGHWVLGDDGRIMPHQRVEIDLDADPMNGDDVEVSNNAVSYIPQHYRYIGQRNDGLHTVEQNGIESIFRYVRFPQQSKRDRIKEAIRSWQESSTVPFDDLADQIEKIYTEE